MATGLKLTKDSIDLGIALTNLDSAREVLGLQEAGERKIIDVVEAS